MPQPRRSHCRGRRRSPPQIHHFKERIEIIRWLINVVDNHRTCSANSDVDGVETDETILITGPEQQHVRSGDHSTRQYFLRKRSTWDGAVTPLYGPVGSQQSFPIISFHFAARVQCAPNLSTKPRATGSSFYRFEQPNCCPVADWWWCFSPSMMADPLASRRLWITLMPCSPRW